MVELPEPAEEVVARARDRPRHPPARRPPRRDGGRAAAPRRARCCASRRTSSGCGPRLHRLGPVERPPSSPACASPAPAASTAPASWPSAWRRSPGSCWRDHGPAALRRRRHRVVRRAGRRADAHQPDVVVVNAGGARFTGGRPDRMTADDVASVARPCRRPGWWRCTWRRSTTAWSRAARTPTCRSACPRTAPRCRHGREPMSLRENSFLADRHRVLAGQPGSRHRLPVSVGAVHLGESSP